MTTIIKVEAGVRTSFPLKKSDWAFLEPEENGVIIKTGDHGIFVSESELTNLGYFCDVPEQPPL